MKVIKKNVEDEKNGYPKRIVCDHCGAELEYDRDDEFIGQWGMRSITCPECMEDCFVGDEREVTPQFPDTFDHVNNVTAKEVKYEDIQKFVDKCYEFLMNAEPGDHYMTGAGDVMVFGFRYEDSVDMYVTRDFYEDVTCL